LSSLTVLIEKSRKMTIQPIFSKEELKMIEKSMFYTQMNSPLEKDEKEKIHQLRGKIEKVINL